ncbi:MAG: hypothetical protein DCC43_06965 [Candidatus Brocadia sp.]|jgi:hypothetical protein|uniref:DUF1254 domain-containing protein n=1 Tax=Candidatus Brocadia fulgida TaxID=380242 RepID=A0A0M2UZA0_9BACT|nr:MAG: hypothetical protein BROFUL_01485 [Candidatus Brocadia fulgida]MCC6324297.1 DUF1254 domain-containing protein [Candidatus Brocadia sp.]MCE7911821.1 DUF1254 domain-containing protein [Candidatus Brocadia sp. AMX3]OQZ01184.1 MAG: hypothetical protein B6D35_03725 [Candidatus Brocadia sp. UTAMX2]MBV6519180.1 hypothetical protein [Candidatus Brocadia fulgida]
MNRTFKKAVVTALFAFFSTSLTTPSSSAQVLQEQEKDTSVLSREQLQETEAFHVGVLAYLWGYPLVMNHNHRLAMSAVEKPLPSGIYAPLNALNPSRRLLGPEWKARFASHEVIFAQVWFDLLEEPIVVEIPDDHGGRYFSMTFYDYRGDLIRAIGTRSTEGKGGTYLLVGPHFRGETFPTLNVIHSPTRFVYGQGRIVVKKEDQTEIATVVNIMRQYYSVIPYSRWLDPSLPPKPYQASERLNPGLIPQDLQFFHILGEAMKIVPPREEEQSLYALFKTIGLSEHGFDYGTLGDHTKAGLKRAIPEARVMMVSRAQSLFSYTGGWFYPPLTTGWSGLRYLNRAAMCYAFDPFAGLAVEQLCPRTNVDAQGEKLDGAKKKYRLHFKEGLPPVTGEWSLTLYDKNGIMFGNPANRYSISSITSGLEYQKDGSLTILIQAEEPTDPKEKRNWLPAPKGEFWLMVHLWQPNDKVLKGKWKLPGVEPVK